MAAHDNVRVLYEDGLVLGADEMQDDQRYYRAGLERRSLARDVAGIAYGLELREEDGHVFVEPGVAYAGDGKVIVLRSRFSLTTELSYETLKASFPNRTEVCLHVYLRFREAQDRGAAVPALCGASLDPRIAEGYAITVEDESLREHFERVPPYEELGQTGAGSALPLRLGRVCVTFDEAKSLSVPRVVVSKDKTPCEETAPGPGYPTGAQYIGTVTETLVHPKRWNDDGIGREPPWTLRLLPEEGVEVRELIQLLSNLILRGESGDSCADLRFEAGKLLLALCDAGESFPVLSVSRQAGPPEVKLLEIEFPIQAASASIDTLTSKQLNLDSLAARQAALDKLEVTESAKVKGSLALDPANPQANPLPDVLTVNGPARFAGAVAFGSSLSVSGSLTTGGDAAIGGSAIVAGDMRVARELSAPQASPQFAALQITKSLGFVLAADNRVKAGHAVKTQPDGVVSLADGPDKIVGIAATGRQPDGTARIVVAGPVEAQIAADVEDGADLKVGTDGKLVPWTGGAPRVARALKGTAGPGTAPVLVCL